MSEKPQQPQRRRRELSAPAIVHAAIEILDTQGVDALTLRSLAARLSTGAGAMYRHVAGKDALLEAAAAELVTTVTAASGSRTDTDTRTLMLDLFDLIDEHPWLGSQLARAPWQTAVLLVFETVGERLVAAGVPEGHRFEVASAFVHYLLGAAGQYAASARLRVDRPEFLATLTQDWTSYAGGDELPFVRATAARLADHDDRRQFAAGVDLLLAGAAAIRRD